MSERSERDSILPDRILVGVDERGLSDDAIRLGLELGRRLGAKVDLVQAVPMPSEGWVGRNPVRSAAMNADRLTQVSRAANLRVRRLANGRGPAPVEGGRTLAAVATRPESDLVRVVPGHPAQVLLETARRTRAGMIVLGAHAKKDLLDFGSTMRAVFAKSLVPVWIQAQPVTPIRTILAAVDLSPESLAALAMASSLAKALGASVSAVYCSHRGRLSPAGGFEYPDCGPAFPIDEVRRSEREQFERTMEAFEWHDTPYRTEFVEGEPVESLLELSRSADLVVLGAQGRTGLASVILGGVAYSVLKRSCKPTLVVHGPGRTFLL